MQRTVFTVLVSLIAMFHLNIAAAENLLSIYHLAQQNDPTFRAAQQEYNANREIRRQSLAAFLPVLNLSANYDNISQEYSTTGTTGTSDNTNKSDYTNKGYTLSLNQAIYHHDFYVQYRQAGYQVQQASANFNIAAQDLVVRTATAYFKVLGAIDNLTFAKAEKKSIAEQLHQTKQRFEVGLTAITDVHEAQSRFDQSTAQTIAAENLLAINRENLRELIGQYPQSISPLADDAPLVNPDPNDIEEWAKIAAKQSLALLASEKAMQIAREEINRKRSGHYPTLDLVASVGHTEQNGGALLSNITGSETNDTRIGVRLNIPLYQGGLVNSQTNEAAYRYQAAREKYEQQRRATERQTRSSYLNVIANISQVRALRQALKSSRTALEATEAGYQVGTRTAVDVLNSRREVFRSERDYAQARYTYILETLRLQQAAGILGEDDVVGVNNWLQ